MWIDTTAPNTPKTARVGAFVEAILVARWCVFLRSRGRPSRWQVEQASLMRKAAGARQVGVWVFVVGPDEVTWMPPELDGASVRMQVDRNCSVGYVARANSGFTETSEPTGSHENDGKGEDVPPC